MDLDRLAALLTASARETDDRLGLAVGEARLDIGRSRRTGVPEVVFGAGKTPSQIAAIMVRISSRLGCALTTGVGPDCWATLSELLVGARYHAAARTVTLGSYPQPIAPVMVVAGGSAAEQAVAAEAAECARVFGLKPVERAALTTVQLADVITDSDCAVIILTAGENPHAPSVAAGLTPLPVIAVPVRTGSAGNLDGITPLVVCLAACAPGVAVVNVDNGFGAAALAKKIVGVSISGERIDGSPRP